MFTGLFKTTICSAVDTQHYLGGPHDKYLMRPRATMVGWGFPGCPVATALICTKAHSNIIIYASA